MRLILDLWDRFRREARALLARQGLPVAPAPGLYTYPIEVGPPPHVGQRRLHLRVAHDGTGVLFVDVTDVIHLNPTAVAMVKLALDEVPQAQARDRLACWFGDVDEAQLTRELGEMYAMVEGFRTLDGGCPICDVAEKLAFAPIFSTSVHAPYKADLALTYRCNNACPHCYNEPDRFTMPSLEVVDWYRVLDTLKRVGVPHLILTGGEPTLYTGLAELIRYADGLGQIVGMNTNGRALAHMPLMQSLAEAGLNHVQVTLESCRAEVHNAMVGAKAFAQTVQGIKNAMACGVHTITNTTITRRNQDHALETVDFLDDLGLRTFAMNGMI